jgi:hypothetical protein
MVVYRRFARDYGRDGLRSVLGVPPGKIQVPDALRDALGRTFAMRKGADVWIPIAGTNRLIRVTLTRPPWHRHAPPNTYAHVVVVDTVNNLTMTQLFDVVISRAHFVNTEE